MEKEKKIVLIISGGNVDTTILSKLITQGLIKTGRYKEFRILVEDKPEAIQSLVAFILKMEAGIIDINIDRYSPDVPFNYTLVNLALETKNNTHSKKIPSRL